MPLGDKFHPRVISLSHKGPKKTALVQLHTHIWKVLYFTIYKGWCFTPFIYQTDAARSRRTGFSEKSDFCILPHLNTVCHDSWHKVGHQLRKNNLYYVRLHSLLMRPQKPYSYKRQRIFLFLLTVPKLRVEQSPKTCKTGTKDESSRCSCLKLGSREDKSCLKAVQFGENSNHSLEEKLQSENQILLDEGFPTGWGISLGFLPCPGTISLVHVTIKFSLQRSFWSFISVFSKSEYFNLLG